MDDRQSYLTLTVVDLYPGISRHAAQGAAEVGAGGAGLPSEKDAKLAQKLGQLEPFTAVRNPTGRHRPTPIFWTNLTPFSLQALQLRQAVLDLRGARPSAALSSIALVLEEDPRHTKALQLHYRLEKANALRF